MKKEIVKFSNNSYKKFQSKKKGLTNSNDFYMKFQSNTNILLIS